VAKATYDAGVTERMASASRRIAALISRGVTLA
jgi:hypothetical protein